MLRLRSFFSASSIAVIGASNNRVKVGHQILRNLLRENMNHHEPKKLFPVNPSSSSILGLPAFPSITAITTPVELVIIVTPMPTVKSLVDEITERNTRFSVRDRVKSVIIISAGFAETSEAGGQLQTEISLKLQAAGIHLLGPNTLGIIHPSSHLNASFAQSDIPEGNLGIISQSGAMLTAIFHALKDRQAGVSFAISLGNKAGVNENDCLEYALHDHQTRAVIMYLESFSDLPQFFELCSQLRLQKPVLLLKGGTSSRGQTASASHTAALATNQVLLEAASQQMGFTLVKTIEELMNVSFFLAQHRQLPENVMVITNAGGPAVTTIDALSAAQVPLASWSKASHAEFDDLLPGFKPSNPLDLLGDASPERFRAAIQIARTDAQVDSMLVIVTPQAVTDLEGTVQTLIDQRGRKPLFVALMGGDHLEKLRHKLRENQIVCSAFPNDLVESLHVLHQLSRQKYGNETFMGSAIHAKSVSQLKPPNLREAFQLLASHGFQLPKYSIINQADFARWPQLTYPLFAKTANLSLLHKKELGAVYGVVNTPEEARLAYQTLQKFGNDVLFQEVIIAQHELLLGIENDPQFGLYLSIGLGGSYTNILADRVYIFLPATKKKLISLWQMTKAYQALKNDRAICDLVVDQMVNLQKLIMKNPWIRSVEINPLAIGNGQVLAADVKLGIKV